MGVVLDASVLIILDELRLLRSLLQMKLEVIAPRDALREVRSRRVANLARKRKLRVVDPDMSFVPVELRPRLGEGESAVLAYCLQHKDHWALLDDVVAREIAMKLGMKCAGTARLLRFMAEKGAIRNVPLDRIFVQLKNLGFWIDDSTIGLVLREPPPNFEG